MGESNGISNGNGSVETTNGTKVKLKGFIMSVKLAYLAIYLTII
jgi:hypothetical protein